MSIAVPRLTAIASTLLWFAGVFIFLLTASLGLFATSSKVPPGSDIGLMVMLLWAIAFGAGGYALRKQKWGYRWWPIGLAISSLAAVMILLTPMAIIVLVLNIVALVLVVLDWRKAPKG